ncbi:YdcF family protein [Patescibacteria group bacterium]|nr:YdcF family protein [Patescibacteria group bacterium]MBU3923190.1 YdcF family protein [Patescibacteria group bacterium]
MKEKFSIENKEQETFKEILPEKFEALVVLGKNWREYPPKKANKDWPLRLSIESKMSALAAGEMFKAGLTDKIIFSTGKTAGKYWPSEAEIMSDYLKKNYSIPDDAIILEKESIDTVENAEMVAEIIEKHNIKNIALMTSHYHLKRSVGLFNDYGMEVHSFPSEEMIKKRSSHYEKFVENYLKSGRVKKEKIKEAVLRSLLVIDSKGKIPRIITKRRGK